jgi:single-stranded-DNA-specific exonuclease
MEKSWKLPAEYSDSGTRLQKELKISPVICNILVERGLDTYEKCRSYFRPELSHLHDPFLMKDMEKAVSRIGQAMERREKILVFGDYDVDGTTAVASMYQFLCRLYDPEYVEFYIPHRYREGYGISKAGIDHALSTGRTLIVSLDCGIKSVELITYAAGLGIDFIVCDHHLPDETLPPAVAILNPKQPGCPYPYKDLCGCGVGFKLMAALAQTHGLPETTYLVYLDLLATAIAADIVPMTGENRIMTFHGLKQINTSPCPGFRALIELGGIQKQLSINNVVFVIAPRINAAGRMDDARKAVQLFIEKDPEKAMDIARQLHSDNSDRKEADTHTTAEALAMMASDPLIDNRRSTVVYAEHWHKGVVGIVASRLIEHYYRPTVVLTRSGDVVAGSARSVNRFNLYEAIHACREHLLGYGGHFAAAGLSLLPDSVDAFRKKFEEVVGSTITPGSLVPEQVVDAELNLSDATPSFYRIISQMEPFGPENMRPVFIARNVTDKGFSKIVKEQHLRFVITQRGTTLTGIGFNLAGKHTVLENKKPFDILFTLDENEWNGNTTLQMKVIDIRPAEQA